MANCKTGFPSYQTPDVPCISGGCSPSVLVPLEILQHRCDMKHPKATIVKYENKYFVSKVDDATGDPTLEDNHASWAGGFCDGSGALRAMLSLADSDGGLI